ncbi:C1 family peptidase [Oscillochloris sp. ZM17-4]|uniref:C1 family peptidase n=1 Tax=Oscillochloris sp. ZM17-4 TaxID=2866714 RepID=UPI001C73D70E|nr:C1 family peptidase [Oscillochloris sp. ZM17-4]MBX0327928.1 C1 family peptidase [Oscillochloris sp. ZM17-4]
MPERTLTPLDGIAGFDETIRKKLADPYWITTAEEFRSTINFSGRKTLAAVLGVDDATLGSLADAVNAALPQDTPFDIAVEFEVGAGLDMTGVPEVEASFATVVDLPEAVEPLTKARGIPDPQNQGQRNTCVAFTLASMLQILSGDPTDLSEQFLYYLCKERDGIPGDVGTNPALAIQLLRDVGICTERTWPYHAEPNTSQPGGPTPPAPAYDEAKRRRISGFTQLQPKGSTGVNQIQAQLAEGKPVMIGMPIYSHWTGATQATILGRLRFPLPSEQAKGGHAMCVVGYRTDATAPGGGYFIVRNSWGPDWGKDNSDGPGYCHMPFLLVSRQNLVAFVADGIVLEEKVAAPPKKVGSRGKSGSARLGSSGEGSDNLMAIYADLLGLKDQVDDLTTRLQRILGVPMPSHEDEDEAAPAPIEAPAPAQLPRPAPTATPEPAAVAPAEETIPYTGPLVFLNKGVSEDNEELDANGVDGVTGQLLLKIDTDTAAKFAKGERSWEDEQNLAKEKEHGSFATTGEVDQNQIQQAGWAVVVHAEEDVAVLKALWPLVQHRMRQMEFSKLDFDFQSGDTTCGAWMSRHTDGGKKTLANAWGKVPPVLLVRPDEPVNAWLKRHGTSQGPVDPALGVPYYLMLVGRPGPLDSHDKIYISLHFQYELDFFWGVGRLVFSDVSGHHRLDDYKTYAERVVAWETRADAANRLRKEIAFFGTRHEDDNSTQRSADELVAPLVKWNKESKFVKRVGFNQDPTIYLGDDATKNNLEALLTASTPPALLFTASHGVGLPMSDPARLVMNQGSLVTADFEFGNIKREHWMAGEDLDAMSSANLDGMIALLFACYGAGCPDKDEFIFDANKKRQQIAPFPFIAQLPQRMLLKGALAVLGHVERAWTYSFSGTENVKAQIQPFQDVVSRLMQGMPVGSATDQFNVIQGSRSLTLTQELEQGIGGSIPNPSLLARLWMARNDARNYALLGDPAVKLAI